MTAIGRHILSLAAVTDADTATVKSTYLSVEARQSMANRSHRHALECRCQPTSPWFLRLLAWIKCLAESAIAFPCWIAGGGWLAISTERFAIRGDAESLRFRAGSFPRGNTSAERVEEAPGRFHFQNAPRRINRTERVSSSPAALSRLPRFKP